MKNLYFIILLVLASCGCDSIEYKREKILIYPQKDTLTITYYKTLRINSNGNLEDANGNVKANNVASFSIISSTSLNSDTTYVKK